MIGKIFGEPIVCPHPDGDYILTVEDMLTWATGYILLRQVGQGEEHAILLNLTEAEALIKQLEMAL